MAVLKVKGKKGGETLCRGIFGGEIICNWGNAFSGKGGGKNGQDDAISAVDTAGGALHLKENVEILSGGY